MGANGLEPLTSVLSGRREETEAKKGQNQAIDRSISEISPDLKLPSLVDGYILTCRVEGKSGGTVDAYKSSLNSFLWYLNYNHLPAHPGRVTSIHIKAFLWYVASASNRYESNNQSCRNPACSATINKFYRTLHAFFNWLKKEGIINDNPVSHLKPPKFENKIVEALKPDEIRKILAAFPTKTNLDTRNHAIISILLDSGLRISELANLKMADVDTKSGTILIRRAKGGKQRVVHIGSKAQKALWRYVALFRTSENDCLFVERNGQPLAMSSIQVMFKRLSRSIEVKVHPHKLRHTFAISFLRLGGDVFNLKYLLGHSSLQMTQRYLQSLAADDAIREHTKHSPLDNLVF
jgi:site-specific recombinase XerD